MQSVIMAGGFGTRLHPLTCKIPKPMVPILGRPMIHHVTNLLVKYGYEEAITLLYYFPEKISKYLSGGEGFGITIRYKTAEADLGTAGSVRNASDLIEGRFLVISADVLTDFDLSGAVKFHNERNAVATIILTRHPSPLQFGIVITNDEGKITRFLEKPAWGQVFSDTINTGIYILEPEVFDWIPKGTLFDFSQNLFPRLLEAGKGLYGYIAQGYWRDVGNLREYRRANEDALWERVKLEFPGKLMKIGNSQVWVEEGVDIDDDITFDGRVLLGKNTKIHKRATIYNTVIGSDCVIQPDAQIEQSVIWDKVDIGIGTNIQNSVIATSCKIGAGATIQEHSVLSENCKVGDEAVISEGVKIWPDKIIEDRAVLTESLIWTDRVGGELFTKSRVSGAINWEISPEFSSKLGAAFGSAITQKGGILVVSRDPDRASQVTARALFCGAMSAGMDVEDLGLIPLPVLRHYLFQNPRTAGVHIRKSPYFADRQDIIFLSGEGFDLSTNMCRKIEQLLLREGFPRANYEDMGKLLRTGAAIERYTDDFLNHIDCLSIKKANFRFVVDYQFGAAAQVMPKIHEAIGADVIPLNAYVNPNRLTKTRAERDEAFQRLSAISRTLGANVGFAIDPTGERLTISDEYGHIYQDNELLYVITKLYLSLYTPSTIAVPISATMGVNILARERGVRVIRIREEHLAMMEAARNPEISFIGGTRGGFIFTDFGFSCDAMFAMVKVLELMARSQITIAKLAENMPKFFWIQQQIDCPWHAKGKVMRSLIEYTDRMTRDVIDGVRVITSDAWILVLPDAERAVFHLLAEGKSENSAQKLISQYSELIEKWQR